MIWHILAEPWFVQPSPWSTQFAGNPISVENFADACVSKKSTAAGLGQGNTATMSPWRSHSTMPFSSARAPAASLRRRLAAAGIDDQA